jgi:hypothetical protein
VQIHGGEGNVRRGTQQLLCRCREGRREEVGSPVRCRLEKERGRGRRARGRRWQEHEHGGGGSHDVGGANGGSRERGPTCGRMGRLAWAGCYRPSPK